MGLGNYTAGDDAIGVRVIEYIAEHNLEDGFRAIDMGANSLNLVAYLDPDTTAILAIDATKMGEAPGEVAFFTPNEVQSHKELRGLSTHEGDLLTVLEIAKQAGYPIPPIVIMGIEPKSLQPSMDLTPELGKKIKHYSELAISHLKTMP